MKLIALLILAITVNVTAAIFFVKPSQPAAQSLADHMEQQLATRSAGNGFDFVGVKTNGGGTLNFPPSLATNFYLRDVTNILASSHFYKSPSGWGVGACLSPITPRHCVASQHVTGNNGNAYLTNLWLLPDGTLYTNWIVAQTNLGNDLDIVLMAKTNPAVYRVLGDISGKVGHNVTTDKPLLGVLMHHASLNKPYVTTFVAAMISVGQFGHTWNQFEFGDYSTGYTQIVGDSSSPMLAIINGEAVLVAQTYLSSMYGPSAGLRATEVNLAMQNLSTANGAPIYTLTLCDLSPFPNL